MTASRSTAFTSTVRVVNRVHSDTADGRAHTSPTLGAGFTQLAKVVFAVADLANRGATVDMNPAHLARTHANSRVRAFASCELS